MEIKIDRNIEQDRVLFFQIRKKAEKLITEDVVTWETCSMRKWLNNEFFASAFLFERSA